MKNNKQTNNYVIFFFVTILGWKSQLSFRIIFLFCVQNPELRDSFNICHFCKVQIFWEGQILTKSPPLICPMYCQSNNWWRSRKILWPSQNIWTLYRVSHIERRKNKWLWWVEGSIIFLNYGAERSDDYKMSFWYLQISKKQRNIFQDSRPEVKSKKVV